jgi:hypothetical protein
MRFRETTPAGAARKVVETGRDHDQGTAGQFSACSFTQLATHAHAAAALGLLAAFLECLTGADLVSLSAPRPL